MRAAVELFRERHYSVVVAVCGDALTSFPENVHIRLLRARALTALRRDEEAQRELRRCLRLDPRCSPCYRLLGELSLRRDELDSAEIFLKEAVRLDPLDPDAKDLLQIARSLIDGSKSSTVAVEKLPAATATVDSFSAQRPRGKGRPLTVPSTERGTVNQRRPKRENAAARGLATRGHCETRRGRRTAHGSSAEGSEPMLGEYLVSIGAISPGQLEIALDYQRCVGIRLGDAAVALGYISQPKLDWAAHAYHARHKRL